MNPFQRLRRLFSGEQGSSLAELALLTPFLMFLLLGVFDFGRAYYLAMEVAGAAQAGAEYGIHNPTDITGIEAAAQADAPDVPNLTVGTPTYGCECSDGTSYSEHCSTVPACTSNTNLVYAVKVTTSTNYSLWFHLPGIPLSINISKSAMMRSGGT